MGLEISVGIIIILAIALIITKRRWLKTEEKAVYVCERCSENHCECTRA